MEMMTSLREVNVDNNIVGWYQSMLLGTFNLLKLIQNLSSYHESIPNSVVILYDPVQTANGSLTIRAFRLSGDYRALAARAMNEYIEPSRIFEELPLKVSPRFPPFPLLREPFFENIGTENRRSFHKQSRIHWPCCAGVFPNVPASTVTLHCSAVRSATMASFPRYSST